MKRGIAFYGIPTSIGLKEAYEIIPKGYEIKPIDYNLSLLGLYKEANGMFKDKVLFLNFFRRNINGLLVQSVNLGSFLEQCAHAILDEGEPERYSDTLLNWYKSITGNKPRFTGNEYLWYHVMTFSILSSLNKNFVHFKKLENIYTCVLYKKFFRQYYPFEALELTKEKFLLTDEQPPALFFDSFSIKDLPSVISRNKNFKFVNML